VQASCRKTVDSKSDRTSILDGNVTEANHPQIQAVAKQFVVANSYNPEIAVLQFDEGVA